MIAVAGGRYRVVLETSGAFRGQSLAWLPSAMASRFPGAEVESVKRVGERLVVTLRMTERARPAELQAGQEVTPLTEGLSLPGVPVPQATIKAVMPVTLPAVTTTTRSLTPRSLSTDSAAPAAPSGSGWGAADGLKLAVSAALIGSTFVLLRKGRG